ncbi:MAG: LemA family protein, partial [Acidimicrobiaceae bacterium]
MSNLVWLVVIVVLVGFVALSYNSLVQRRNQVKNAWSQIDVQLKRRIELIPNLVETVKGYADFEQKTLQQVITARNVAMAAPSTVAGQAGADNALSGALRQLFALSEAYPDLKANASFLSLQEELSNTESRI